MADLKGIVNKPQFDTAIFEEGKAVHVKQFNLKGYELKDRDGLIGRVNPLEIVVWLYDKRENDCDYIEISIDSVVSGEYEISLLKEED